VHNTSTNRFYFELDKVKYKQNYFEGSIAIQFDRPEFTTVKEQFTEIIGKQPIIFVEHSDVFFFKYDDFLIYSTGAQNVSWDCENSMSLFTFNIQAEDYDRIIEIKRKFFSKLPKKTLKWATWNQQGHVDYYQMLQKESREYDSAHFPWLNKPLNQFYNDYINSSCSILVLLGPPGTGKSSLINDFAHKMNRKIVVSYDKDLMVKDNFYIDFLSGKDDLLVMEDADTLLYERDTFENNTLSKILNTSDGIVDCSNKKIIFSANIENKDRLDSALLRPGRCFAIIESRGLYPEEVRDLNKVTGLEIEPDDHDEMTLANYYSGKRRKKRKVGF
jgi:hypothetical protein